MNTPWTATTLSRPATLARRVAISSGAKSADLEARTLPYSHSARITASPITTVSRRNIGVGWLPEFKPSFRTRGPIPSTTAPLMPGFTGQVPAFSSAGIVAPPISMSGICSPQASAMTSPRGRAHTYCGTGPSMECFAPAPGFQSMC